LFGFAGAHHRWCAAAPRVDAADAAPGIWE
jgi:hypothetical protein